MCLAVVGLLAAGVAPIAAQTTAQQPTQPQQAPAYKVGTVTIKFVGTANVNEQVVRANMQIRDGGEFDEVMSMSAAMFAPRPIVAAAEMAGVCRPGGLIAMANWMPGSFVAERHETISR